MKNPRTPQQNSILHAMLSQLGMDAEAKADLVLSHTNNRTSHSSEMSVEECDLLIHSLQLLRNGKDRHLDKKRKRVISHLIEAGYTTPDGKADMTRIYAWVKLQKHKKQLNDHSSAELSQLIHAAAAVRDYKLKAITP
jgi:hypothetical protein